MTTRKRNEFLDIESSDDEGSDQGYDSENAEESKGRARVVKRRKLSDDEGEDESGDEELNLESADGQGQQEEWNEAISERENEDDDDDRFNDETGSTSKSKTKSTTAPQKPRKNKTGVIYFSSLPPYLKPSALKSLLVARGFGPVTKLFLSPAVTPSSKPTGSSSSSGKRNRRRMYTDGWVEFASKRTAKICAETLNATIVGGKKGGWYHDDIWNMKYLRGFKWADLMEQVQRERREAEAKRRIEDARARKEEKVFIAGVEKGKEVEGIRKKREEKERRKEGDTIDNTAGVGENTTGNGAGSKKQMRDIRRVFRQNEIRGEQRTSRGKGAGGAIDPDVQRVLGKIF